MIRGSLNRDIFEKNEYKELQLRCQYRVPRLFFNPVETLTSIRTSLFYKKC